ncbi:MAG: peptidyl-alpha-hydroxyglycine alpha-amidating lyase family protein [Armatimonadota bacterium]
MKAVLPIVALVAAATAGPVFAPVAQAQGPEYQQVSKWPKNKPKKAPRYRKVQVSAVSTDQQGRVFVFQRSRKPVLVFDRDGRFIQAWGKGFSAPHGCRVDPEGNVWLTDVDTHQVLKYSPEGERLLTLGVKWRSGSGPDRFNGPADVAFGPNGDVYVADGYYNSRVVRLSREGQYLGEWGQRGNAWGEFNLLHSIATDAAGRVYVADRENWRIQVFTPDGQFIRGWKVYQRPFSVYVTPEQQLFVGDGTGNTVSIYTLEGRLLSRIRPGNQMNCAHMVTVDDQGCLYVANLDGKRVHKLAPGPQLPPQHRQVLRH